MMGKKGFGHLVAVVVIAVLFSGVFSGLSVISEKQQKAAVGKVLSSSDEGDKSGSSGSGSGESDKGDEKLSGSSGTSGSSSSGSGSAGEPTKIESRTLENRTKIETSEDKTKIEVRNEQGRFETRVEEGKQETKIRTEGLRIFIKQEGDRIVVKVKNERDEEVELSDDEEEELIDDVEDELAEDGVRLATGSGQLGIIQNGRRVRTNFPLSVNAETGELMVSTPAGDKIVAVLPDAAVSNMIKAGILTRVVEEPLPSPTPAPGESTGAAVSVLGAGIELAQVGQSPVYVISGVRSENFLGLVPVDIKIKALVSLENGNLVDIREGILTRLLDLLSF